MEHITFASMTVRHACLPFRFTFSHNLASRAEADTLFVEIRTPGGGVGYGQALPREYLTGETMDSAARSMREDWWPLFRGLSLPGACSFEQALEAFAPIFREADSRRRNAAYAAVEIAAMGAVLSESGLAAVPPGASPRQPLPLVGVIGGGGAVRSARIAGVMKWLGYRRFKVKVGRDREGDVARLRAVRAAVGKEAWLAVDANCAWEPDEALERMRELKNFGIAVVEEPLERRSGAGHDIGRLERDAGIPVMLDEGLCTLDDAERSLEGGAPAWWNLRLLKNGGFSGVRAIAALADCSGVGKYGGILVGETGLAAAAGRAAMFAAGVACWEYGFSRVFLRDDPFRGSPAGYRGVMAPPLSDVRGFGVRLARPPLPGHVVSE